jgi:muramidase (phage lysozyme)/molecular chaperone GrpE (heat shock protein)
MRSFINPEVINKNKGASPEAFSTFMLGRKGTIGSSVLNSAKNKIVNFDRAAVKPISSNAPGVISSISTNVTNNSTTNVSNANNFSTLAQRLSQNVNTTLSTFINNTKNQTQNIIRTVQTQFKNSVDALTDNIKRDYQQKVQSIENTRPFSVLKKFLDLYKNAVNFITYFGDEKNFKRIRVALKTLRRIFDESFNIATLVRQVIVKIVRQLSNLPTASGNAPDLSLDLKVPGGALKQQGGSSIGKFARSGLGKAVGFGAAAGLGIGAAGVGAEALSGMSKAEQFQEEKLRSSTVTGAESQSSVSEGFLSGMERIIDTFSNAVNDLIKFVTERSKQQPSASPSPGSAGAPPPPDSGSSPGGNLNASDIAADTPEEQALIATIRESEGTAKDTGYNTVYGGAVVPELTQMTLKELYDAAKPGGTDRLPQRLGGGIIPYAKDRHNSTASGAVQIMPQTLKSLVDSGLFNWDQTFSPETQNQMMLALARRRGVDPTKPLTMREIMTLRQEWAGMGRFYAGQGGSESEALNRYNENLREARTRQNISSYSSTRPVGIQTGPQVQSQSGQPPSQVRSQGPQSRASVVSPGTSTAAAAAASSQPGNLQVAAAPPAVIVPLSIGTPPSYDQASSQGSQSIGAESSNAIAYLPPSDSSNPGWPYASAHLGIT